MRFRIIGASRQTGDDLIIELDANDAAEAERRACTIGVLPAQTLPLSPARLEYDPRREPNRAGMSALRWLKLLGIAIAIVGALSVLLRLRPVVNPPPTAPLTGPRVMPGTVLPGDLSIRSVWIRGDAIHGMSRAIEIRNNRDVAITITGVRFNDEFDAWPAEEKSQSFQPARNTWPAQVPPGRSVLALVQCDYLARTVPPLPFAYRGAEPKLYPRPITQVTVFTAEGSARILMSSD